MTIFQVLFRLAIIFLILDVVCLLLGLVLHAYGFYVTGHKLVAMSGLCGGWLVRNCPYQMGDKCKCWTCPKAADKDDGCLIIHAHWAATHAERAKRKAARMARKQALARK